MRFDSLAIRAQQRKAFEALTAPILVHHELGMRGPDNVLTPITPSVKVIPTDHKVVATKKSTPNPHYVPAKLTTSPSMLIQELPWVNTTTQFVFDFSINGPQQVPGVNNNIVISKNNIFAIYAVQILFGTGTNAASFVYRSHGVLPADDAAYNSIVQLKTESSTYIDYMEGQFFRDNPANSNEYFGEIGMQLINPIRIISGELGVNQIQLNLKNPSAALVFSANTVLSMRLHGVAGLARG